MKTSSKIAVVLFTVYIVFILLDYVTTAYALTHGAVEGNLYFADMVVSHGWNYAVLYNFGMRLALVTPSFLLFEVVSRKWFSGNSNSGIGVFAGVCFLGVGCALAWTVFAVANNIGVIFQL